MENLSKGAEWSTSYKNDLPDSAFLYIEDGGKKDKEGKTTPRSLRHFPYRDMDGNVDRAHILNAVARIPQAKFLNQKQKDRMQARARAIYLKYVKYKSKKSTSFVKAMNAVAKKDERSSIAEEIYEILVGVYQNNPCVKKCLSQQKGWEAAFRKHLKDVASNTNTIFSDFIRAIVMAEGHRWFEASCPHCFMDSPTLAFEQIDMVKDFESINGYTGIVPKACRAIINSNPALKKQIQGHFNLLKAIGLYDEYGVQIRTPQDIYNLLFEYIRQRICNMTPEQWSERIVDRNYDFS